MVIGLALGAVGATLFRQSLPGAEGSAENRVSQLEVELRRSQNRVAELEDTDPRGRRRSGRTLRDGARDIADDIREGRPVTPDDIFRTTQPLLRDLSPLFDRIRVREQKQRIESLSGEYVRKHDLTPDQQKSLEGWFERKEVENAKRYNDLLLQDGTRLEDLMMASRDTRPDDGLDEFMAKTLSGEKLASFQAERMVERAQRVQEHADMKVERLDSIVALDADQRDRVFAIMARDSPDYDPAMTLEGAGGDTLTDNSDDTRQAMFSVLTAEQRTSFDAEMQHRREEAQEDMAAIGLSLPEGWDMLEMEEF